MRQILCVIDSTESSGKVLVVAAGVANACRAHLTILFPYRLIDYGYHGEMATLKVKLESEAKQKFMNQIKNIPAMTQVSYDFQPEIGFLADRINAHVKRVDMVIIGQQQSVTTNDVKGFNLQNLIAHSKLPFMIVPEDTNDDVFLSENAAKSITL